MFNTFRISKHHLTADFFTITTCLTNGKSNLTSTLLTVRDYNHEPSQSETAIKKQTKNPNH